VIESLVEVWLPNVDGQNVMIH